MHPAGNPYFFDGFRIFTLRNVVLKITLPLFTIYCNNPPTCTGTRDQINEFPSVIYQWKNIESSESLGRSVGCGSLRKAR